MKDQRWYIRYKIEGTANLKTKATGPSGIKTDLLDISYRGFATWANKKIESGSEVEFELITKLWSEPVVGKGEVKYSQETKKDQATIFRLGIEFKEIDKRILQSIINYLVQNICAEAKKKTI
jgi:c-di-GMP-binding flagellar brake protein YcgR